MRFAELLSTTRADEALSAMVSQSLIFQPSMRLSMISNAGTTNRVAARTCVGVTPGPFQFAIENKGNFRFDFRLNQFAHPENRRVLQHRVIEDVTVIGLIYV